MTSVREISGLSLDREADCPEDALQMFLRFSGQLPNHNFKLVLCSFAPNVFTATFIKQVTILYCIVLATLNIFIYNTYKELSICICGEYKYRVTERKSVS